MKAAVYTQYGPPDVLHIQDVAKPTPKDNEVLITIRAVSVNAYDIGFTAPAWSTMFWFAGIGLVCARSWLPIPWHRSVYLTCAGVFAMFHVGHAGLVFFNLTHLCCGKKTCSIQRICDSVTAFSRCKLAVSSFGNTVVTIGF